MWIELRTWSRTLGKLRIIFVLPLNILSFRLQQTFSLNSQVVNNLGFVDCIISVTMLSSMAEAQKQL